MTLQPSVSLSLNLGINLQVYIVNNMLTTHIVNGTITERHKDAHWLNKYEVKPSSFQTNQSKLVVDNES